MGAEANVPSLASLQGVCESGKEMTRKMAAGHWGTSQLTSSGTVDPRALAGGSNGKGMWLGPLKSTVWEQEI